MKPQFKYTFRFPYPNRKIFTIQARTVDEAERQVYARAHLMWIERVQPRDRKARILKPQGSKQ